MLIYLTVHHVVFHAIHLHKEWSTNIKIKLNFSYDNLICHVTQH